MAENISSKELRSAKRMRMIGDHVSNYRGKINVIKVTVCVCGCACVCYL